MRLCLTSFGVTCLLASSPIRWASADFCSGDKVEFNASDLRIPRSCKSLPAASMAAVLGTFAPLGDAGELLGSFVPLRDAVVAMIPLPAINVIPLPPINATGRDFNLSQMPGFRGLVGVPWPVTLLRKLAWFTGTPVELDSGFVGCDELIELGVFGGTVDCGGFNVVDGCLVVGMPPELGRSQPIDIPPGNFMIPRLCTPTFTRPANCLLLSENRTYTHMHRTEHEANRAILPIPVPSLALDSPPASPSSAPSWPASATRRCWPDTAAAASRPASKTSPRR